MDTTRLEESHRELIGHLEEAGYSPISVHRYEYLVDYVLRHNGEEGVIWDSYADVYDSLVEKGLAPSTLANYRSILGGIQGFHLRGEYPDETPHNHLFATDRRGSMAPEFASLLDHYEQSERRRGVRESTVRGVVGVGIRFFEHLERRGVGELAGIGWDDVASFFVVDGAPARGASSADALRAIFRAGLSFDETPCRLTLDRIPKIRTPRKNAQYLKEGEVGLIRKVISDASCGLTLRDRAIGLLLLHLGLRCSDIAGMTLGSIAWAASEIRIVQRKTGRPLSLSLVPVVGNAIYDYITEERRGGFDSVFLTEDTPTRPINPSIVNGIANKILRLAGVRQEPGQRGGAHIFRHRVATGLLAHGVSQPVISGTLGHAGPASTEAYLSADLAHLNRLVELEDGLHVLPHRHCGHARIPHRSLVSPSFPCSGCKVTICDLRSSASSRETLKQKRSGKRWGFLVTAWLSTFVSTP